MTIQDFITKYHIGSSIASIPFRSDDFGEWDNAARHYAFRVYITEGERYTTPEKTPVRGQYSQGSGIKTPPQTVDILNSLVIDTQGIDGESFDLWCSNFGYETDSRKAYATYQACLKEAQSLRELLGLKLFNQLMKCETL